ncbi:MAG: hypothetical protein U0165_19295 [Polyangiaceae bacterium]
MSTTLYFVGIVSGLIASLVFRRTVTKGRGLPLLLEMPVYRAPLFRTVLPVVVVSRSIFSSVWAP